MSLPGKTFISGEYAVLAQHPGLIICSEPRFTLKRSTHHSTSWCHSGLKRLLTHFNSLHLIESYDFINPYPQGGFGASSALFLFFYLLTQSDRKRLSYAELIDTYQQYYHPGEKHTASGADLVSQLVGDLCLFTPGVCSAEKLSWPFAEMVLLLVPTGNKINTHDHVSSLSPSDYAALGSLSQSCVQALKSGDDKGFCVAISSIYDRMCAQQLVHGHTAKLMQTLFRCPELLAAKGCGALGADTLLLVAHAAKAKTLQATLQRTLHLEAQLLPCAMSHGLKVIA